MVITLSSRILSPAWFSGRKNPHFPSILFRGNQEKENFTVIVGNHTRKRTDGGAINSILYADDDEMDARAIDSSARRGGIGGNGKRIGGGGEWKRASRDVKVRRVKSVERNGINGRRLCRLSLRSPR